MMSYAHVKIAHEDYDRIVERGKLAAESDQHFYFQIGIQCAWNDENASYWSEETQDTQLSKESLDKPLETQSQS
jgi:hypothetical protein